MVQKLTQITGSGVPLVLDDIDTDRIIPARYLRCVTFDGIGEHAFEDDRAQDAKHPFSNPRYRQGVILVAGRNFGCGSSREHAPQALMRWGIKAIVGESFAGIFFDNCTSLGIPCVTASRADLEKLGAWVEQHPSESLTVDVVGQTVHAGALTVATKMLESARSALVNGDWDFLGKLLEGTEQVKERTKSVPYMTNFGRV